jgi:hypothetical protein
MPESVCYVRLYADETGNSHIQSDLRVPVTQTNFVPPAPAIFVSAVEPASGYAFLIVPPGYFGDWHPSPKRQWILFLSGRMEFEVGNGERYLGQPGAAILLEDTAGQGHRSRVLGDEPAIMVAVQT